MIRGFWTQAPVGGGGGGSVCRSRSHWIATAGCKPGHRGHRRGKVRPGTLQPPRTPNGKSGFLVILSRSMTLSISVLVRTVWLTLSMVLKAPGGVLIPPSSLESRGGCRMETRGAPWHKKSALTNCRDMEGPGQLSSLHRRESWGVSSSEPQVGFTLCDSLRAACIPDMPVVAQDSRLAPRALSESIPKLRSLDT